MSIKTKAFRTLLEAYIETETARSDILDGCDTGLNLEDVEDRYRAFGNAIRVQLPSPVVRTHGYIIDNRNSKLKIRKMK